MSVLADEARLVARDPLFRIMVVLILVLTLAALWNGRQFQLARDATASAEVQRSIDKRATDRASLLQEASGAVPTDPWGPGEPTKADWNATRPSGPLAALSFGREDLEPLSAPVSLWMVREDNLFRKHEFGSALVMSAGRFDAGFLVVLLLPIFLLALTYSVVAEERETGRLKLALVQGRVASRLALRFVLRAAPVFLALALIAIAALSWGAPPDRLAWWLAAAALYLSGWLAAFVAIATLRIRQEVVAIVGAGLWMTVVVLIPAVSIGLAQSLSPSPSAFTVINGARSASLEANRKLMENLKIYVSDHPDLMSGDPDENDWAAKLYVSQQVIGREIAPVMQAAQRQSQAQDAWITRLRFLSPTSVVDDLLTESAGTGRGRQADYVAQVTAFLKSWQQSLSPLIFARARLTADDVGALPRFSFQEPPVDQDRAVRSLIYLALFVVGFGGLVVHRLRRLNSR